MKRGEVWWANLPPPAGKRPVLLLSRNAAYAVRALITIAPITRTVRGIPAEVPLGPADGLPQSCVANCDSIATIPKALLVERITALGPTKLAAVNAATRFALAVP
jgi:mRNA interferase MazF